MKTAMCPGSFDPVTIGHVDIISRASKIFDVLKIGVFVNPLKEPIFTTQERIDFLKRTTVGLNNVEIITFDGLIADYVDSHQIDVVVKGLRDSSDFQYEFQSDLINKKLSENFETVFLASSLKNLYISSTIIKEIAFFGGDISEFVPKCICEDVIKKIVNKN